MRKLRRNFETILAEAFHVGTTSTHRPGSLVFLAVAVGACSSPTASADADALNSLATSQVHLRADLYHGQTCAFTGQPLVLREIIGYYECFNAY